jgi:SAM-dependent methyltransferase
MLDPGVLAFARGALPAPPARILEIGAGSGELVAALRAAGYDVTGIDPSAADGTGVEPIALIDATGAYDAAIAVVSPGGVLAIDELDIARYDERVTGWWLHQRRAAGHDEDHDPASILQKMRDHVHPLDAVRAALAPHFALGEPVRGPYLHRWHLPPGLRDAEERLIGEGRLPATGARLVARRR